MFSSMPLVLIFSFLAAIAVRCRENFPLLPPAWSPPRNVRAHIAASDRFIKKEEEEKLNRKPRASSSVSQPSTLLPCATALPPSHAVCCRISLAGSRGARPRTPTQHTLRLAARSVEELREHATTVDREVMVRTPAARMLAAHCGHRGEHLGIEHPASHAIPSRGQASIARAW